MMLNPIRLTEQTMTSMFFESGEYDDLFTPEDLVLLKKDIKKIKDYLSEHPELLEE